MRVATVCTGIGSPEMALKNLGIPHEIVFGCEIDKYARQTYLANFEPGFMEPDMTKESWEGEKFYSDLFIGGIPCQAFSLAGKRLGELDPRGLLFFDFYRYVKNQKPKYFIIENVKGLLSDNGGATFQNWINLLGQSVNGDQFMFPHEDSLMYNLNWQVLNTKDYGLPQNRERVFLIGIRNDLPNSFVFPKGVPLKLRLKDILEDEVDEKYYFSDKMIAFLQNNQVFNKFNPTEGEGVAACLNARLAKMGNADNYIKDVVQVGNTNPSGNGMNGNVFSDEGLCPTLTTNKGEGLKVMVSDVIQLNPSLESGGKQPYQQNRVYDGNGIAPALCRGKSDLNVTATLDNYRIRKLTPKEVFRLQGFPDEFLQNAKDAGVSNSQLYKQAGNSISVPVIQAILKNLI